MRDIANKKDVLSLIAQGAIALTPNNRLSAALERDYFHYAQAKTLNKPQCLPYSTAIINAYHDYTFSNSQSTHPILLNDAQCQHLWRKIIKTQSTITYSEGLLRAVIQAWEHCQLWQIAMDDSGFNYTPQTQQFQKWCLLFNQQIIELHAITEYQIIPFLIAKNVELFSQSIIWICFDEFHPQQSSLQAYLNQHHIKQYHYDLPAGSQQAELFAAEDSREEQQQLLSWLQLKIAQGEQKIAVVVPNLEQESVSLKRVLQKHFPPNLFNISLGQSLNKYPLIAHALSWLNLGFGPLNTHQATLLLQSPFIGAAKEEFLARSHYLQDSNLLQEPQFSLHSLVQDLSLPVPKLAGLLEHIEPFPNYTSPNNWVRLFQERLNSIGFPGDYGLDSANYQCYNRFAMLLDEFRQLNQVTQDFSLTDALDALKRLAENTIFQAQKTQAPIQISGLLEASGCEFDSLWVTGLTDQCLPQKTRLSAFIPPQIQRELAMPHSTPERELLFAKQTLQRLLRGSKSTVFSYPKLQGDSPNLACSLITHFAEYKPLPFDCSPSKALSLVPFTEDYEVPLLDGEKVSGGTALLANQAKCPFKAFAEHRLKAKALSQSVDGLDHREKGQLIHKIMELFWHDLKGQGELFALSNTALNERIDRAISQALKPLAPIHPDSFPLLVQEIEYARLKRLLMTHLDWEKQRPSFEIAALEQSYTINLAGIDFAVRVDRLDQVGDKKWVIDYKSTLPATKPWNEDRPKEPQLLLYALLDQHINALLLMQLKTGKVLCSGFSEEKQEVSGISSLKKEESWAGYRDNWQQQLTSLAEEFRQGHCPPLPQSKTLCQQCDFQNLCRYQIN